MSKSPSSFAAALAAPPPRPYSRACSVRALIDSLDKDDAEQLVAAIEVIRAEKTKYKQSRAPHTVRWLIRILREHNYLVGDTSVERHINKICTCEAS